MTEPPGGTPDPGNLPGRRGFSSWWPRSRTPRSRRGIHPVPFQFRNQPPTEQAEYEVSGWFHRRQLESRWRARQRALPPRPIPTGPSPPPPPPSGPPEVPPEEEPSPPEYEPRPFTHPELEAIYARLPGVRGLTPEEDERMRELFDRAFGPGGSKADKDLFFDEMGMSWRDFDWDEWRRSQGS